METRGDSETERTLEDRRKIARALARLQVRLGLMTPELGDQELENRLWREYFSPGIAATVDALGFNQTEFANITTRVVDSEHARIWPTQRNGGE